MATLDYSKIWGANSPLAKYEFTEADYLRGWEFIGSMPPARTMFDAWMRKADEKMRWLYDNALVCQAGAGLVQRSTRYELGDILYDTQLTRHDLRLECVQAGTTAATLQDLSGVHLGQGITDGTVVWRVKRLYTIDGDMFEIDTDGGIMPTAEPHYSVNYELDEDGNIMPKAM